MKFNKQNIENLANCLNKMERFFAFKYEMPKEDIAFVIKGHNINVLVKGSLKETIVPAQLMYYGIDEESGQIIKVKP